ncbi:Uncharacterised protein [Vibrio cholerae]|nr:Uncharacterised protein [Vibrio cholerae]
MALGLRHVTAHLKHLSLCLIKKWKVYASHRPCNFMPHLTV